MLINGLPYVLDLKTEKSFTFCNHFCCCMEEKNAQANTINKNQAKNDPMINRTPFDIATTARMKNYMEQNADDRI